MISQDSRSNSASLTRPRPGKAVAWMDNSASTTSAGVAVNRWEHPESDAERYLNVVVLSVAVFLVIAIGTGLYSDYVGFLVLLPIQFVLCIAIVIGKAQRSVPLANVAICTTLAVATYFPVAVESIVVHAALGLVIVAIIGSMILSIPNIGALAVLNVGVLVFALEYLHDHSTCGATLAERVVVVLLVALCHGLCLRSTMSRYSKGFTKEDHISQLQERYQSEREMLQFMFHELRNPLQVLSVSADLCRRNTQSLEDSGRMYSSNTSFTRKQSPLRHQESVLTVTSVVSNPPGRSISPRASNLPRAQYMDLLEAHNDLVATVDASTSTIVRLMDDVQFASQIRAGEVSLSVDVVDLRSSLRLVVDNAVATVNESRERSGLRGGELSSENVTLRLPSDLPKIKTDSNFLIRIVHQLLCNALFHRRSEVELAVELERGEGLHHIVTIKVQDDGKGMSQADIDTAFDLFTTKKTATHRRGSGSGLGLATSRLLAEHMKGELALQSRIDVGTVATLRLVGAEVTDAEPSPLESYVYPISSQNEVNTLRQNSLASTVRESPASAAIQLAVVPLGPLLDNDNDDDSDSTVGSKSRGGNKHRDKETVSDDDMTPLAASNPLNNSSNLGGTYKAPVECPPSPAPGVLHNSSNVSLETGMPRRLNSKGIRLPRGASSVTVVDLQRGFSSAMLLERARNSCMFASSEEDRDRQPSLEGDGGPSRASPRAANQTTSGSIHSITSSNPSGQGTHFTPISTSILNSPTKGPEPAPRQSIGSSQDRLSGTQLQAAGQDAQRVLVIEDNKVNQMLLVKALRVCNPRIRAVAADDGAEGVQQFIAALQDNDPFDLVFTDVTMPKMDGWEATREMRAAETKHDILPDAIALVVAVTGNTLPEDVDRCYEAGMDGVIHKPCTVQKLASWLGY